MPQLVFIQAIWAAIWSVMFTAPGTSCACDRVWLASSWLSAKRRLAMAQLVDAPPLTKKVKGTLQLHNGGEGFQD